MSRFAHVRAVLFDLDGTLVDSAPDLGAAADRMRVARGLPSLAQEHYRPRAGSGRAGHAGRCVRRRSGPCRLPALKDEFFVTTKRCMMDHTGPFDGVAHLVADLSRRGLVWGVVTNKSARFAEPLTRALDLFAGASVLVCGDTTPHTKPHPAPLLEAARRLDIAPAQCMYVGDDHRDILAGQAAGMSTVAADLWLPRAVADPLAWGADAAIKSPLGLLELLAPA
jgi:2-phosphoglycolate phosphatase